MNEPGTKPVAFRLKLGLLAAVDALADRAEIPRSHIVSTLLKRGMGVPLDEIETVYLKRALGGSTVISTEGADGQSDLFA